MLKVTILASALVGECMARALTTMNGIERTLAVQTVDELARVVRTQPTDVLVVGIALELLDERLAVTDLPEVRERGIPVVFLSDQDQAPLVDAVQRHGAAGFLLTSTPLNMFVSAIQLVADGGTIFDRRNGEGDESAITQPTERELGLMRALSHGLTNIEAAHELDISPRTVESHLRRLFARYNVSNRVQLLLLAVHEGWISAHDSAPDSR